MVNFFFLINEEKSHSYANQGSPRLYDFHMPGN